MKKLKSNYYTLLLLVMLFAAPGAAAYIFFQHPAWLGAKKINKGTLLTPALEIPELAGRSKWRVLLSHPGDCDEGCLQQMDILARMRLALGRKLYLVDLWLILDPSQAKPRQRVQQVLKDLDAHVSSLVWPDAKQLVNMSSQPQIFIVNPENYLILSYQAGTNPADIYKDLKLLLGTTETKSS